MIEALHLSKAYRPGVHALHDLTLSVGKGKFVCVLTVAAALTVANVVRLACVARSDEIEIMRLVGAPLTYVRGPFVLEGILQGGVGASVALALLAGELLYSDVVRQVLGADVMSFLPPALGALIVFGGMAVGCVGELIASLSIRETPTSG